MLIDLARNDLGRIAAAGTVRVDRMMEVEMYSHVMHIVSEVSATLAPGVDVFDVIRATFPAGTVTGAPKIRAMQIIDGLEPSPRGAYAGLVGYFSYRGGFDSCITIRSAVAKGGKIHLQTGAGIVYDSDPGKEYVETENKARAMLLAIAAARGHPEGRRPGAGVDPGGRNPAGTAAGAGSREAADPGSAWNPGSGTAGGATAIACGPSGGRMP